MTAFPTRSNRLIQYHEFGPAPGGGQRLERTVRYVYYKTGHAANILVKDEWLGTGTAPLQTRSGVVDLRGILCVWSNQDAASLTVR